MEQQHNFEDEQTPSLDFIQGFNHCDLLAELTPDLLEEISQVNNTESDYFNGFFAAKEHHKAEIERSQNEQEFQKLRVDSKEHNNEIER